MNKIEEKCCMYVDLINAKGSNSLLEPERAELHNCICDMIGIPHSSTKHITGDLIGVSGRQLYSKLLKLKEELKTKSEKDIIMSELLKYRDIWGNKIKYTKDESVRIYSKLMHMRFSVPIELISYIESSMTEAEVRHDLTFRRNIMVDIAMMQGIGGL